MRDLGICMMATRYIFQSGFSPLATTGITNTGRKPAGKECHLFRDILNTYIPGYTEYLHDWWERIGDDSTYHRDSLDFSPVFTDSRYDFGPPPLSEFENWPEGNWRRRTEV